jgi:hypothetical protein
MADNVLRPYGTKRKRSQEERTRDTVWMRQRRASFSPEELASFRARKNAGARARRAAETPEQKLARQAKDAERMRLRYRTRPDVRAANCARNRRERANETPEDRLERARKLKAWRVANRDRLRQQAREKIRSNIQLRLARNMRTRLYKALRDRLRGRKARSISAVRDLGCSIAEFVRHVERQWRKGMGWGNYGPSGGAARTWHLDHIKPLKSFDLTDPDQAREAFHFTNYRPLWAKENSLKGGKRELLL